MGRAGRGCGYDLGRGRLGHVLAGCGLLHGSPTVGRLQCCLLPLSFLQGLLEVLCRVGARSSHTGLLREQTISPDYLITCTMEKIQSENHQNHTGQSQIQPCLLKTYNYSLNFTSDSRKFDKPQFIISSVVYHLELAIIYTVYLSYSIPFSLHISIFHSQPSLPSTLQFSSISSSLLMT